MMMMMIYQNETSRRGIKIQTAEHYCWVYSTHVFRLPSIQHHRMLY